MTERKPKLRMLVFKTDADGNDREEIIDVEEILYAFQGSDAALRLIDAPWTRRFSFRASRVYVRTQSGLYKTTASRVRDLNAHLPEHFRAINRGVVINLNRVRWSELRSTRRKALGFYFEDGKGRHYREGLLLSRRSAQRLGDVIMLNTRRRRRERDDIV